MRQIRPKLTATVNNCVRVTVWDGADEISSHVSLTTFGENAIYASYWPNWRSSDRNVLFHPRQDPVGYKLVGQYVNNTPASQDRTYEMDLDIEDRKPDYTIYFYSLNVSLIKAAYKTFIEAKFNWSQIGDKLMPGTQNCSGLVAYLLQAGGGICNDFYDKCQNLIGTVTPKNFHPLAHKYEQDEKSKYVILDSHGDEMPLYPKKSFDLAMDEANRVDQIYNHNSNLCGKLIVCKKNGKVTYGIGLNDNFVFCTDKYMHIISKPQDIHIVNDIIYKFSPSEIIKRLKYAIICFRKWDYNTGWNDEHLARLIVFDHPFSYKTSESISHKIGLIVSIGEKDEERSEAKEILNHFISNNNFQFSSQAPRP